MMKKRIFIGFVIVFSILYSILLISSVQGFQAIVGGGDTYLPMIIFEASCTESWSCSSWTTCVGNIQNRTCTDVNVCGTTDSMPATGQACTPPTGGGGSSPYTITDCDEGQIVRLCECGGEEYNSGWCINETYYDEPPEDVEEPDEIISEEVLGYYFIIETTRYAYNLSEPIEMTVKTYYYNTLVNMDLVFLEVMRKDTSVDFLTLEESSTGIYPLDYVNNLEKGNYDFMFSARKGSILINQTKPVKITDSTDFYNILITPSGDLFIVAFFKDFFDSLRDEDGRLKPVIYYVLVFLIILILLILVIIIKKRTYIRKRFFKKKSDD